MEGKVLISNASFNNIFDIENDNKNFSLDESSILPPCSFGTIKNIMLKERKLEDFQLTIKTRGVEEKICRLNCRLINDSNDNSFIIDGSIHDITTQVKAEETLKIAKRKAEESERIKTEFLSQMSHEIRTPINSISQAIEFLKDESNLKGNEDLSTILNIMDQASKRIIRTIHLILNLAEVTSGAYEYVNTKIDLYTDCAKQLYHEFYPHAAEKGLNFTIKKNTELTQITGDEYSIKCIFEHVLDNSFKFTEHGSIELIIDRDNLNKLYVDVQDTGIGISEEYLPEIFNAFSQEESGYTRKFDGNGLGLALVKKYCEINNADISIQSNKNKGTNVRITFNPNFPNGKFALREDKL